jgi:hypothetical protein
MLLQVANASGCSVSASPSCAVAFRLLQPATMPSADAPLCSGCGGPRDRGTDKPYCRKCHNDYQRDWQKDRRAKSKRALEITKRSGLA